MDRLDQRMAPAPVRPILSRAALEGRLQEELARTLRYGSPFSVVMFLLDAPAPAHAPAALMGELPRHIRGCDLIGLWRTDQYLVTAPALPLSEATGLAVKLRHLALEERARGSSPHSLSLGVAQYLPGESLHTLLTRAGRAMHVARRRGGNRVETG